MQNKQKEEDLKQIHEELERICALFLKKAILAAARHPESPLHSKFTWTEEAAHQARLLWTFNIVMEE